MFTVFWQMFIAIFGSGTMATLVANRKNRESRKKQAAEIEKYQAEVEDIKCSSEGKRLANVETLINLYKAATDKLLEELNIMRTENKALRSEMHTLKDSMRSVLQENASLKQEMKILQEILKDKN